MVYVDKSTLVLVFAPDAVVLPVTLCVFFEICVALTCLLYTSFRSRHWKHPYPGNLFAGHYRSGRCGNCHRVRYQDYRQPESRGRQPAYRRQAVAPLRRGQGHRYNQRFPYRLSGCDGTFQRGMDYRGRGYRNIHLPDTAGRGRAGCLSSWQRQYGHGGLDDAGRHGETESDGAREYGHG